MPNLKRCTLSHIQEILSKKKKVLLLKECCFKKVPSWPELSVKQCYDTVVRNCPDILLYLPTPTGKEVRLPEREFFWTVVYSLYHDATEEYIMTVEKQRRQKPNL